MSDFQAIELPFSVGVKQLTNLELRDLLIAIKDEVEARAAKLVELEDIRKQYYEQFKGCSQT